MTGHRQVVADINVGEHITRSFFGLTFNVDTIGTTLIASAIVVGLGLFMVRRAGAGVPGKLQVFFEAVVDYVESQVGLELKARAPFVVPLAVTVFVFILVSNWISLFPSGHGPEFLPPPTADTNTTYALGLLVFLWSLITGIRRRGLRAYVRHLREPYLILFPINLIEEIIKPFTLALRLFGNIFAGTVLVLIISLLPVYILWFPNVLWRTFDLFIGLIQAFIFALLTIIYFGTAVNPGDEHETEGFEPEHAEPSPSRETPSDAVPARAA